MGLMQDVNKPSSLHKDFVSRCLRSEVKFLQGVLNTIEQPEWPEDSFIRESLMISRGTLKDLIKYLSH